LNLKKELLIGIGVALICTLSGIYLYVAMFTNYDLVTAVTQAYEDNFLGALISIGAVANFLPFFVYLKKKQVYRARGVLILSIAIALVVLFLNAKEIYEL